MTFYPGNYVASPKIKGNYERNFFINIVKDYFKDIMMYG